MRSISHSLIIPFMAGLILLPGFSVNAVQAEMEDQPPIRVALWEQHDSLDRQIIQLESRIAQAQGEVETEKDQSLDAPLTMARLLPEGETLKEEEAEVSVLEEIMVQGTYLDPFEEENLEKVEDPWEGYNTTMFAFNQGVDRYVLKPVAQGYHWIVPDPAEEAIGNALHNIGFVPRVVNNLLQGKGSQAGIELGRFLVNSTLGIAGLFDVAGKGFGLEAPEEEDTGQTLAVYGVNPGPYVVFPFLRPMTVRDGVGYLGDLVMDPLNYVLPFVGQLARRGGETVNTRSQNFDRFQGVEEGTLDLYAAVRDAYVQSRAKAIQD